MSEALRLVKSKIYKTGQTRGADDDQIYQNRVNRNSRVLIPYEHTQVSLDAAPGGDFERGYTVLISPATATTLGNEGLADHALALGQNALVFYRTREEWNEFPPDRYKWSYASSRDEPLGGQYVARIPNTTAVGDERIRLGYTGRTKGAGIRVFEYADSQTIADTRDQLEMLFFLCPDAEEVLGLSGVSPKDVSERKGQVMTACEEKGLSDLDRLYNMRAIDQHGHSTCPLCLGQLSAEGFVSRLAQAQGREIPNLTVTEVNLFHIEELRIGHFGHRPYNLGWGCHHCNVVVRDHGVDYALSWMREVLNRDDDRRDLNAQS